MNTEARLAAMERESRESVERIRAGSREIQAVLNDMPPREPYSPPKTTWREMVAMLVLWAATMLLFLGCVTGRIIVDVQVRL